MQYANIPDEMVDVGEFDVSSGANIRLAGVPNAVGAVEARYLRIAITELHKITPSVDAGLSYGINE